MDAGAVEAKARGRPRDRARHAAVLDATIELLAEVGYDDLTLADVARRAGVGRPLLYQWWASKGALVAEALFEREPPAESPNTGSFAGDVAVLVSDIVVGFARPALRNGLPGLVAAINTDEELRDHVQHQVTDPLVDQWSDAVRRGVARGEVREGLAGYELFTTVRGAALFHLQVAPTRQPKELADYLTALLVGGVRP
jgi:AcrR family transcriptional regulator